MKTITRELRGPILGKDSTTKSHVDSAALRGSRVKICGTCPSEQTKNVHFVHMILGQVTIRHVVECPRSRLLRSLGPINISYQCEF